MNGFHDNHLSVTGASHQNFRLGVPVNLRGREARGGGSFRADAVRSRFHALGSRTCAYPGPARRVDIGQEPPGPPRSPARRGGHLRGSERQQLGPSHHRRRRPLPGPTTTGRDGGTRSHSLHSDTTACIAASLQARRRTRTRSKGQLLETRDACSARGKKNANGSDVGGRISIGLSDAQERNARDFTTGCGKVPATPAGLTRCSETLQATNRFFWARIAK